MKNGKRLIDRRRKAKRKGKQYTAGGSGRGSTLEGPSLNSISCLSSTANPSFPLLLSPVSFVTRRPVSFHPASLHIPSSVIHPILLLSLVINPGQLSQPILSFLTFPYFNAYIPFEKLTFYNKVPYIYISIYIYIYVYIYPHLIFSYFFVPFIHILFDVSLYLFV